MDVIQVIKDQIEKNPVILYMKGTPQCPQCGFSAQVVEAMTSVGKPFAYVNILEAPEIRQNLKEFANWPTFPQLWVNGELVGGCSSARRCRRDFPFGHGPAGSVGGRRRSVCWR